MKAKLYFLLSLMWVFLCGGNAAAQAQSLTAQQRAELRQKRAEKAKLHPNQRKTQTSRARAAATATPTFYGSIVNSYDESIEVPGMYSFTPNTITPVKSGIRAYGGGTYGNGTYYAVNYEEDMKYGVYKPSLTLYDAETWNVKWIYNCSTYAGIASDLTYDPMTWKVYGCFFDDDYTSCTTLGTLEYDTSTYSSKAIGQLPEKMAGLACSATGQLYGVGASGKFYAIDKQTAEATEIGNTGTTFPLYCSAVCDYETGKVYMSGYWAGDYWTDCGIWEIDPTTGEATLLPDFDWTYYEDGDLELQVLGLFIKQDITAVTPPAAVSDLQAELNGNSLTVQVMFALPTLDINGNPLEGEVNWEVKANGKSVATGSGMPGDEVYTDVTVEKSGHYTFTATTSQGNATGPEASTSPVFVGDDTPAAPTDLTATANTNGSITLTWTAPTTTSTGGPLDSSLLRYQVVRTTDHTTLASTLDGTTYTDTPPTSLDHCAYEVSAKLSGRAGEAAATGEVEVLNYLVLPYLNEFKTAEDCEVMGTIDANGDGVKWGYNEYFDCIAYPGSDYMAADDWLITPRIKMQAKALYHFTFVVSNSYPVERMEAAIGTSATDASTYTHVIAEPTDISRSDGEVTFKGTFQPETDGDYYFGIHAISNMGASNLYVHKLAVDYTPATAAAAVDNYVLTPGEKGAVKAELTFNAPTQKVNGETLSGTLSVKVNRDGKTIDTLEGLTPGQACSYEDANASEGTHTYAAVPVTEDGQEGAPAEATCFIGIDVPSAVRNLRAAEDLEQPGLVHLSWDAPEVGANGGYLDPEGLDYIISPGLSSDGDYSVGNVTSTDHQVTISGKQDLATYSVYASNSKGTASRPHATTVVMVGPALEAPVYDSFRGVTLEIQPWTGLVSNGLAGESYWDISDGTVYESGTQDGDGGACIFYAQAIGKSQRFVSPKIDIRKLQKPVLNFWLYADGKGNTFRLGVSPEYGTYENIYEVKTDELTTGWHRVSLPLDDYKSRQFVQFGFEGIATATTGRMMAFDNVAVTENSQTDPMAKTFTAPESGEAGTRATFTLSVRNNASQTLKGTDYTVKLYKNGKEAGSASGVDIAPDAIGTVTLYDKVSVLDKDENTYYAQIVCANDENADNNTSAEQKVKVILPNYPAPQSLTAAGTANGVELAWSEPDMDSQPGEAVTDGFEDYETFLIEDFGDWITVDRDGLNTKRMTTLFGEVNYEHAGEPMAWQVFNPDEAYIFYGSWLAHNGNKYVLCMASSDQGNNPANDDWLISPVLDGSAQTISFFAKPAQSNYLPEKLEVLYSTDGTEPEDFVKVGETIELNVSSGWTEVKFDVPKGAYHFAIRCISEDKLGVFVDDVTYIPYGAMKTPLRLMGYNVYRDGTQLNIVELADPKYTDTTAKKGETYEYVVTAVYDLGESVPSDAATINVTGITQATSDATAPAVSVEGTTLTVSGAAAGEQIAVYTADGRCIARRNATTTVETFYLPQPGTYVVRTGHHTTKVSR